MKSSHIVRKVNPKGIKCLLAVLIAGLVVLAGPGPVQGQFIYTTNTGSITITGYSGSGGAVIIPSTIIVNGVSLPVTGIGADAFLDLTSLTSVTIPGSVISIGYDAFVDCTSLISITVDATNSFYSSVNGVLFDKNQNTLIQYPSETRGNLHHSREREQHRG